MNARLSRVRGGIVLGLGLLVSIALAGCGSNSSPGSGLIAPTATTAGSTGSTGNWPAPQAQDYQGCPPQGDGGDGSLNLRKNRTDTGTWQSDTVGDIVGLAYPSSVGKVPRANWSGTDAAAVAQSEGRPLQIEGYMLFVRHEGTESPNCHDPNARDFHMWLGGSPGGLSDRASSMIVEVTPRSRALNANWQPDSRILGLTGHHVRISGWLMLDQEHPEQVGKTRGTLWEIHPVMRIEVEQGGQWLDLNDAALQISGGPPDSSAGNGITSTTGTTHHRRRHRSSSNG